MAAATAAAPAAASGGAAEPAPKQTLYLNNLNEKVKRGELKKTLYATFSQFGRIMQIICKGSFRLKGQAWIIFDEVTAAAAARRQLHNCPILGKPMHVTFAKEKSTIAATRASAPGSRATKRPRDDEGDDADEPAASRPALNPEAAAAAAGSSSSVTLVVSGVPASLDQAGLAALFAAFPGFQGARLPPGNKGTAFVDFAAHTDADGARRAMDGHDAGEGALLSVRASEQ